MNGSAVRSLPPVLAVIATRLIGTALGLALAWQLAAGAPVPPGAPSASRETSLAFTVPGLAADLVLTIQP